METFLQFLREVLKGIVREVSAFFFKKNILENKGFFGACPRHGKVLQG